MQYEIVYLEIYPTTSQPVTPVIPPQPVPSPVPLCGGTGICRVTVRVTYFHPGPVPDHLLDALEISKAAGTLKMKEIQHLFHSHFPWPMEDWEEPPRPLNK